MSLLWSFTGTRITWTRNTKSTWRTKAKWSLYVQSRTLSPFSWGNIAILSILYYKFFARLRHHLPSEKYRNQRCEIIVLCRKSPMTSIKLNTEMTLHDLAFMFTLQMLFYRNHHINSLNGVISSVMLFFMKLKSWGFFMTVCVCGVSWWAWMSWQLWTCTQKEASGRNVWIQLLNRYWRHSQINSLGYLIEGVNC